MRGRPAAAGAGSRPSAGRGGAGRRIAAECRARWRGRAAGSRPSAGRAARWHSSTDLAARCQPVHVPVPSRHWIGGPSPGYVASLPPIRDRPSSSSQRWCRSATVRRLRGRGRRKMRADAGSGAPRRMSASASRAASGNSGMSTSAARCATCRLRGVSLTTSRIGGEPAASRLPVEPPAQRLDVVERGLELGGHHRQRLRCVPTVSQARGSPGATCTSLCHSHPGPAVSMSAPSCADLASVVGPQVGWVQGEAEVKTHRSGHASGHAPRRHVALMVLDARPGGPIDARDRRGGGLAHAEGPSRLADVRDELPLSGLASAPAALPDPFVGGHDGMVPRHACSPLDA